MKAIETEELTKYYGSSRGIINVSLSVEKGDFYGFVGPNGAGKSTVIRTLLGLISPTSGNAAVLGLDITKNKNEILSRVGYLPSEVVFYRGMKVKEIIELSARLRNKDCSKQADILCQRLDIDPTRRVEELSLGNRKKVGIVCAFQHEPELYVLDEPTSGLDPLIQREFYDILCERNRNGATVFLSSHVLSEIGRYCSHAGVISEGKLLVSDSVENLGHTGAKRVTLQGIDHAPTLLGVKEVKKENGMVEFLYSGDMSELILALSNIKFNDITITDPDLEEIFLHYYAKEGV